MFKFRAFFIAALSAQLCVMDIVDMFPTFRNTKSRGFVIVNQEVCTINCMYLKKREKG